MANDDQATAVADAVLRWFRASSVCRKKHNVASEWTVLAGFVARVPGATATYRVLACATGTKCLGRRDLRDDGLVVNDCHAEIVARRALLRYLYNEARAWSDAECAEPVASSIFEREVTTGKLRLKPGHELHLFVSETPCGDASIYPLQEDVVDALVQQRQARESGSGDSSERSQLRLTGAKDRQLKRPRDETTAESTAKRFEQSLGIARTKSGRSDLPADKQTLSMSCSDKIAKWVAFGVQGTLLRLETPRVAQKMLSGAQSTALLWTDSLTCSLQRAQQQSANGACPT
ncbi:hypothetical protein PINS_up021232 [Pythium insidiosum]|nr:hypothetical protein PINS_up021232 [Pythium insidiosum]